MNIETKDVNEMIRNIENIKKRYLDELNKILESITHDYEITYGKRVEAINGCEIMMEQLDYEDQYINETLKENLEPILDSMKKRYVESTMDYIMYKNILKKLLRAIEDINEIDLTDAIKFTRLNSEDMIIQAIEEKKDHGMLVK